MTGRMRTAAIVLNLIVPGAGLILLRAEPVGILIAAVYGLAGQVGALGLLSLPAQIPREVAVAAVVVAGLTWLAGQWVLRQRLRADPAPRERAPA